MPSKNERTPVRAEALENVAPPRHKEIADILTSEILLSQYRTGERLPSERDLSARFSSNRGCIREAVKSLEQLGLVDVQPGGARVRSIDESSLNVIGHMLKLGEFPDPQLVEDILEVMHSLLKLAVSRAMSEMDEATYTRLAALVHIMLDKNTAPERHFKARMELGREFMHASGNLPLKLIADALRLQFLDHLLPLAVEANQDRDVHRPDLERLDEALRQRNSDAVATAMQKLFESSQTALKNTLSALHEIADARQSAKFGGDA